MKVATILGIVLIVLGARVLAYRGITDTTKEDVLDLGVVRATVGQERTGPLPPVPGGAAVAAGVVLGIVGARGSRS